MSNEAPAPCGTRYPRWIDRAFVRGLGPRRRRALRRHVLECDFCRARYDRLAHAGAALGDGPLDPRTLTHIGGDVVARASSSHPGRRLWIGGAAVAAAAVAVFLVFFRTAGPPGAGFEPRGGERPWEGRRPPGVRLFCVDGRDGDAQVVGEGRLAAPGVASPPLRCRIDGELQLVYSTPSLNGLTMVAFANDGEGGTFYYAPRAGGSEAVSLLPDRIDEPLDWSTRLAVKHQPGRYQVIARFYDRPVSAAAAAAGDVEPIWEVRGRLELTPAKGGER